ncbi:uncharacterized protein LOC116348630 [Contarinia nasturtii]|uniref:uncharacterized protein LOC116348630 n=1 Tax=Contarinia nasturtii TaxID=265458 RepID=UPI0012D479E4|nr:uncharacterized protein LOC116348630 [Contarinia nasturtii]
MQLLYLAITVFVYLTEVESGRFTEEEKGKKIFEMSSHTAGDNHENENIYELVHSWKQPLIELTQSLDEFVNGSVATPIVNTISHCELIESIVYTMETTQVTPVYFEDRDKYNYLYDLRYDTRGLKHVAEIVKLYCIDVNQFDYISNIIRKVENSSDTAYTITPAISDQIVTFVKEMNKTKIKIEKEIGKTLEKIKSTATKIFQFQEKLALPLYQSNDYLERLDKMVPIVKKMDKKLLKVKYIESVHKNLEKLKIVSTFEEFFIEKPRRR